MNTAVIIFILIFILFVLMGVMFNLHEDLYKKRVRRQSFTRCTNCGSKDIVKFYYRGNELTYCKSCNLGYQPKYLFTNKEGNLYAEECSKVDINDIIVDTKYYPKYITPEKCEICGAKSLYDNKFIGFSKCNSCGLVKHYKQLKL